MSLWSVANINDLHNVPSMSPQDCRFLIAECRKGVGPAGLEVLCPLSHPSFVDVYSCDSLYFKNRTHGHKMFL